MDAILYGIIPTVKTVENGESEVKGRNRQFVFGIWRKVELQKINPHSDDILKKKHSNCINAKYKKIRNEQFSGKGSDFRK